MKISLVLALLSITAVSQAQSPWFDALDHPSKAHQSSLRWTASSGVAQFQFFDTTLGQLGVEVSNTPKSDPGNWSAHVQRFPIQPFAGLELFVPYGNLERISDGNLLVDASITLRRANTTIPVTRLIISPALDSDSSTKALQLDVHDQHGHRLFTLDHIHSSVDAESNALRLANMDLRLSPWLADQLGLSAAAGMVVGQVHLTTELHIPVDAMTTLPRGLTCADRPLWPPFAELDVALIGMSAQWVRNLPDGKLVIAPSATLKNVGDADVVWQEKFDPPVPPYSNDQHPYLNWAMYRLANNQFVQIGRSGVKHAFFAVNLRCTLNCNNNHILWPGCEDTYGVGTNDMGSVMGPREEVEAFRGLWESTGSFFDPGGIGSQTNSSNDTDENRMVVSVSDLEVLGAQYFISSWYTIRDDVDIYNTMGYRQVTVSPLGGGWQVTPATTFVQGPALDAYVAPDTSSASQMARRVATSQGNFAVAVSVESLAGGRFRYHYSIDNYDFDPAFENFRLPFSRLAPLDDFVFSDLDADLTNDWVVGRTGDELILTAPISNTQRWGMLFSFAFTTTAPPEAGMLQLASPSATNGTLISEALVPQQILTGELIFIDDFE